MITKEQLLEKMEAVAKYCDYTDEFDVVMIELLLQIIDDREITNKFADMCHIIIRNHKAALRAAHAKV